MHLVGHSLILFVDGGCMVMSTSVCAMVLYCRSVVGASVRDGVDGDRVGLTL